MIDHNIVNAENMHLRIVITGLGHYAQIEYDLSNGIFNIMIVWQIDISCYWAIHYDYKHWYLWIVENSIKSLMTTFTINHAI